MADDSNSNSSAHSPDDIELFSTFHNFLSCSSVQDIENEYRCEYVKNTSECQEKAFFFNYIEILYCTLQPNNDAELFGYLVMFIFLCFLMFIVLGITADKFFCPALEMISKVMGLSEHLAGVTLLAFGNGSPDLFTSLASIDSPTTTMYSNLLSGAIFVTAFVGGLICIIKPMHVTSNFLRDTAFFLVGTMYVGYALETNSSVTITEAICIMLIYVVYLVVVLMDQFLLKRQVSNMEKLMQTGRMSVAQYKSFNALRQEASIDIVSRLSGVVVNVDATRTSFYGFDASPNENLFQQFLESLNPIDPDDWFSGSYLRRAVICIKAPMHFILLLFIPITNYEEERHGWSKLLNCLQIVMLPFVTTLLTFNFSTLFGLPICCYPLLIFAPLAILVFQQTRTDTAPSCHVGIACFSAYGAMFVIYSCASETVEILYILGLVMNCSNSFLGATLLAWGNGIGDLFSNAALAFHGYQKMAFAACYGGPFFNTLFSLGLTLAVMTLQSDTGVVPVPSGPLGENCCIFLLIVLFCTVMWSLTINFRLRRSVGVFNILLYILFLLYVILGELEVIQTYTEVREYGVKAF